MTTSQANAEESKRATQPVKLPWWVVQGSAVLSGLMMAASFPQLDWGWVAWIALVPLLLTLRQLRLRSALAQAFTFGFVYFGGLLYWLIIVGNASLGPVMGVVAWLVAVFAQISVMLLFAAGAWALARTRNDHAWFWGVPALWTALEWLRQLGQLGTTWGDISVAQHAYLSILQISKLTGVWGVTFVVMLANVAIAELVRGRLIGRPADHDLNVMAKRTEPPSGLATEGDGPEPLSAAERVLSAQPYRSGYGPTRVDVAIALALIALSFAYGFYKLGDDDLRPTYKVAALQPDINPNVDWSRDPAYVQSTVKSYVDAGAEAGSAGAVVAVWPETAFPGFLRDDFALSVPLMDEAMRYHQTLFVGSSELDRPGDPEANSLIQMEPTGMLGRSYQKRHLVPWGEYVPGRKWFKFLEALHLTIYDRKFGAPVQPLFETPQGRMGATICYESSYPELSREQVARGAGLLMIVSDDTWYGKTAAPRQHSNFAALRAVESDRYLIRAGATGVSEIVDPLGHILAEAPLFTTKVVTARVQTRTDLTPYVRYGDWFIVPCAGIVLFGLLLPLGRR